MLYDIESVDDEKIVWQTIRMMIDGVKTKAAKGRSNQYFKYRYASTLFKKLQEAVDLTLDILFTVIYCIY